MSKIKTIFSIVLFCLFGLFVFVFSQAFSTKDKEPKWIKMMNDPKANYFQTIEEFRKFWEGKALPEEPFEDKEMDVFEREVGLIKNETDWRNREYLEKLKRELIEFTSINKKDYAEEVRAFKGWMQHTKPWVQDDGTIISLEQQQKIIEIQRNELKAIEKRNK